MRVNKKCSSINYIIVEDKPIGKLNEDNKYKEKKYVIFLTIKHHFIGF